MEQTLSQGMWGIFMEKLAQNLGQKVGFSFVGPVDAQPCVLKPHEG